MQKLQQLQILPSDLCTDEEFLRRAYLDVTGRLPTIEETNAYLANAAPDKRAQLIDMLVDSDDFAENAHVVFGADDDRLVLLVLSAEFNLVPLNSSL